MNYKIDDQQSFEGLDRFFIDIDIHSWGLHLLNDLRGLVLVCVGGRNIPAEYCCSLLATMSSPLEPVKSAPPEYKSTETAPCIDCSNGRRLDLAYGYRDINGSWEDCPHRCMFSCRQR